MTNVFSFWYRLKAVRKEGQGLPPRQMRDQLLAEYMGPDMHAKLHLVHRAKRKRGGIAL